MNQLDAAVDSLEESTEPQDTYVASNGLVLHLRKVPQMAMFQAARRIKPPSIPKTWDEDKQRDIENPADPGYRSAIANYQFDMAMLALNTYFILGTRVDVETALPKDVEPIGSNEWVEMLQIVDESLEVPAAGPRRYLLWLTMHALPDQDQTQLLEQCVTFSGGTLELDVSAAQRSFRRSQARDTARRVFDSQQGGHGSVNGASAPDTNGTGPGVSGSSPVRPVQLDDVVDPPLL